MRFTTSAGAKALGAALVVMGLLAFSTPARADVRVTPRVVDFGTVAVGTRSTSVSITLTNTSSSRYARFTAVWLSTSQFSYWGPSNDFSLRPNQSLKVYVSFRPTAAQAVSGTLTFKRANGERITVSLSGTGQRATTTQPPAVVAPSITSQPASRTVTAGQTASFSITATGTTLAYQWKRSGIAISGATSSSYSTAVNTTSDSGAQFTCTVSNSAGSLTSNAAILTVSASTVAPSITSQPVSRTVTAGQTASFSVTASGSSTLAYQWRKNGTAISGATSANYSIAATMSDNNAQFNCTVSNSAGSMTSNVATLTVSSATVAPSITSQPVSRTIIAGQTASFSVSVSGTAPFTYQWMKNGAAISGAASSSYTITGTASDNGAQFAVTVSNSAGTVTSSNATLTVNAGTLLLSANPSSLSFGNIDLNSTATQQVTLTNAGNSNVTLSGLSLSGAGFTANGVSSGQILTPGQKATINVSFKPVAAGAVAGSVTVTSNTTAVMVTLSGSGVQQISHSVSLNWTRSTSTVNGYLVYSSQVSGGPYTKLTNSSLTLPNYTDSSVQNGRTYYYVVTAVGANGVESSYSNQAAAVIQ